MCVWLRAYAEYSSTCKNFRRINCLAETWKTEEDGADRKPEEEQKIIKQQMSREKT
jgi:hypothetical protein